MTDRPDIDPLAPLRAEPPAFDLASTVARAEERAHRRSPRTAAVAAGALVTILAGVIGWLSIGEPSPSTEAMPESPAATQPAATQAAAPAAMVAPDPAPEPTRRTPAPSARTPEPARPFVPVEATPSVLRDLDLDLGAMREIRRLLGSSDRVVLVENTLDRQTCLQIVCEGGDARSIVCSAPAPSPRYVTQPDGRLVFAIERAGESTPSSALVPLRVDLDGAPVIMWYDDVPTVRSVVGDARNCVPCRTSVSTELRPDRSVHVTLGTNLPAIGRIALVDGTGRPRTDVLPAWHMDEEGGMDVAIRGIGRGLYELRLEPVDDDTAPVRILLIVR